MAVKANCMRIRPFLVSECIACMNQTNCLQIFETQEMLGLYGKSPTSNGNYYIATGDCGHILTGGTLAGMIISGIPSMHAMFALALKLNACACKTSAHTGTQPPSKQVCVLPSRWTLSRDMTVLLLQMPS